MALSEQELVRRESLQKIRELGIDPYPPEPFVVTHHATEIKAAYQDDPEHWEEVAIAGRVMMIRNMGKASFAELQDASGKIQIYVARDEICPGEDKTLYNKLFAKLLDIGDYIGVRGFVFRTRMGEVTLHVKELKLLSKALHPLPDKHSVTIADLASLRAASGD